MGKNPPTRFLGSTFEIGAFPDRLKQAMGDRSVRSFALACGTSNTAMRQYLAGKSEPTRPVLLNIAQITGVAVEWLLSGTGPILKGEVIEASPLSEDAQRAIRDLSSPEKFAFIPHVLHVSDRKSLLLKHMGLMVLSAEYIKSELKTSPDDLLYTYVTNDNMEPTLERGDIVIIDRTKEDADTDGVYYVNLGTFTNIKRLQRISGETMKLTDDNPNYSEPIKIMKGERDSAKIIGKIVWFGRSM